MAKLDIRALGLTFGILWAIGLFLWTLIAIPTGYGIEMLEMLATVYPGYSVTFVGALIGAVYGFVDGLIGGVLVAWLYNLLVR